MKLSPLLLLLLAPGCHQNEVPNQQLYGKWILTDGMALVKRQIRVKSAPIYFAFVPGGSIESNWSNCYSFRFGKATELIVNNNCIDCLVANCNQLVWHYSFNSSNDLIIEFGPDDKGLLQRE